MSYSRAVRIELMLGKFEEREIEYEKPKIPIPSHFSPGFVPNSEVKNNVSRRSAALSTRL